MCERKSLEGSTAFSEWVLFRYETVYCVHSFSLPPIQYFHLTWEEVRSLVEVRSKQVEVRSKQVEARLEEQEEPEEVHLQAC